MVHDLARLSPVEAEVESHHGRKRHNTNIEHEVRHVAMTVGIERVVTEFITIRFVMRVGLVHDQVGVRVRRENVLVTVMKTNVKFTLRQRITYWNMDRPLR